MSHEVPLSDNVLNRVVGGVVVGSHPGCIGLSNPDHRVWAYEFDRASTWEGTQIHKSPAASENPPDSVKSMDHALVW
jgi:hypothetical protein